MSLLYKARMPMHFGQSKKDICIHQTVRCIYLYIVFPHLLGGFSAYLHTCTCTIYVTFGPYGIQLVYS
jgi:hypothetical protein